MNSRFRNLGSTRLVQPDKVQHGGKGRKANDPWEEGTAPPWTTALAMSRDTERVPKLSFGCPNLDSAFGGGIPVQGITEIAGEAGVGKTQVCLQLLLQSQLSPDKGGLGGKSYVLTCGEGDFPSRRLRQMASRYRNVTGSDPGKLMDGVCIQNARNLDEQIKIVMEHLPVLMQSHNIKLVVVDSIASLFRSDLGRSRRDIGERSRLLGLLSQQMKRLGDRHRAAFVVVNQVTARVGPPTRGSTESGRGSRENDNVPAMGLLWSQCINTRFVVRRRESMISLRSPFAPPDDPNSAPKRVDGAAHGSGIGSRTYGWNSPVEANAERGMDATSKASFAREIALEMSPSLPVHARCGFVVGRDGVWGVGSNRQREGLLSPAASMSTPAAQAVGSA